MIPEHLDFRRLRHVPIAAVLAERDVSMRRRGHRLLGACPIHGGDNPGAFVVDVERNMWFCFSRCQAGGDVIELVRRLDHCGYRGAARYLAGLAGSSPRRPLRPPRTATAPLPFQPYIRELRLEPDCAFLHDKGIRPQTAHRFEVGHYRGRGFLEGCVGVRLHDRHGNPLGYAGRRLDPVQASHLGKWKLPPRLPKSRLLYNLHRVSDDIERTGVILVECPWGVARLAQLGLPALALLGVHMSEAQARLLARAPCVVLLLDGDEAGRLAANRIRRRIGAGRCEVVGLPDGCDPDDLSDPELERLLSPFPSLTSPLDRSGCAALLRNRALQAQE
jgi:DNA primase